MGTRFFVFWSAIAIFSAVKRLRKAWYRFRKVILIFFFEKLPLLPILSPWDKRIARFWKPPTTWTLYLKYFNPLVRDGYRFNVLMDKTRGSKFWWGCPFKRSPPLSPSFQFPLFSNKFHNLRQFSTKSDEKVREKDLQIYQRFSLKNKDLRDVKYIISEAQNYRWQNGKVRFL